MVIDVKQSSLLSQGAYCYSALRSGRESYITMNWSRTSAPASPRSLAPSRPVPRDDYEAFEQEKRDALKGKRLTRYEMQVAGVVVYVVGMAVFFVIAVILMLFGEGRAMHAQTPKGGKAENRIVITAPGPKHNSSW